MTAARAGFYSPQLDGLRAVAALLVFVHHAPEISGLASIKQYGWVGVDLFLSLSAFLLTRLILLEYGATNDFSVSSFFVRRILRIWPLYLGYVAVIHGYALLAGKAAPGVVGVWLISHFSLVNNLLTAVSGYSPIPYTAHLWTISLEEQAYLILPFVILAYARSARPIRTAIVAALIILAFMTMARLTFYLAATPHPFVWTLPIRGDAIVIGALAAIVVPGALKLRRPFVLMAVSVAAIASVAFFPTPDIRSLYEVVGYTLVGAGCAGLVIAAQAPTMVGRFLAVRPMRFLGKISYGFYVYHLLAIAVASAVVRRSGMSLGANAAAFVLALCLTIALAVASYFLYERLFLKLKSRFERVSSRPA